MHPRARACRKPSGGRAFPSPFVPRISSVTGARGKGHRRVFSRGRRVWGAVPASEEGFTQSDGVQVAPHRAAGPPEVPFPPGPFPRRYYERFDWSFACSTHASECTDCWRVGGRDGDSSAVNTTARPPAVSPSRPRRRRRRAFYWKRRHGPSSNSSLERWGAGEGVRALTERTCLFFFFFSSLQAGGRQRGAVAAAQARATARGVVAGVFAVARARGAVGAFAAASAAAAAAGAGGRGGGGRQNAIVGRE